MVLEIQIPTIKLSKETTLLRCSIQLDHILLRYQQINSITKNSQTTIIDHLFVAQFKNCQEIDCNRKRIVHQIQCGIETLAQNSDNTLDFLNILRTFFKIVQLRFYKTIFYCRI